MLLACCSLHAPKTFANTIFYQPLSQDSLITAPQWNALLDKVYEEGYREIVIQWTQYGPINFVTEGNFLKEVLTIAENKHFRIWLGLYLPDDYYQIMGNNKPDSRKYFQKVLLENSRRVSLLEVLSLINEDNFAGWYLPMELTHEYLKSPPNQSRTDLSYALQSFILTIDENIAVSYFLSESTPLKAALFDIKQLTNMGFKLWLQKGNGLTKDTIAHQVIAKTGCNIGVISENFLQTSANNETFTAKKNPNLGPSDNSKHCQKSLTFSLRYLPYSPLPLG
ncbi:DUF4434 domain-containing protein [uncultured Paraglaciecola sp.]|uniref:DUF4434 domain-containing protein n=1 Tax=uncultured Paraglaciecola sp. TaxID=1765024 RepID=UPI002597BAD8|nr:DUF4434 domain-containing protein [uncultured Paraglaciecola sp.]